MFSCVIVCRNSVVARQFIEETGGMTEAELTKMKRLFKECDEDQDGAVQFFGSPPPRGLGHVNSH